MMSEAQADCAQRRATRNPHGFRSRLVFCGLPKTLSATSHGDISLNDVGSMLHVSALQGRVLPAFSSGAQGRTQRGLSCEPGCRSDLDIPHGQRGAVRGKPMAHPRTNPRTVGTPRCARAPTPKSWYFFVVAACGWPLSWPVLWSRQVQHKRQHLETVSFTTREPKPTVVVATGATQASTSGGGELHNERTEANCCGRDRYNTSVNIWRR